MLTVAALLLGGQVWAEGEGNLLEELRPQQVKRGRGGNVRLFVPKEDNGNDDAFGGRRNSFNIGGTLTDGSSSEANNPTERCLIVSGAISKRGGAMGYINFSLNLARPVDFRGKALKCRFVNLTDNRPETVIIRFYKKDDKNPVWIIQDTRPAFAVGNDAESEITFDPHASGNFKAVIGKGAADDIARIEFFFGNSQNTRHNFRIMGLDVVQGETPEEGGDDFGGGQMPMNGSLMNRGIRERLVGGNGQVGFFENGDQSFIRVRGIPENVEGLEGSWLSFRIELPRAVRFAGKRMDFRCDNIGGVDKLVIRGWAEGSEQPAWSSTSTEKAFPADQMAEFRLSEAEPRSLTMPDNGSLQTAVRSVEFLVSASALARGKELRAEILNLEINLD